MTPLWQTTAFVEHAPSPMERDFAAVLAEVVGVERVSPESHFFDDLGADSMLMARFCARVRKRADLPSVSMQDIYRHPTIKRLAAAFVESGPTAKPAPTAVESPVPAAVEVARPASTLQYLLCGTLQLLFFLGYTYLAAVVAVRGYEWVSAGSGVLDIYLRSVLFGGASFLGLCLLPILAKWLLIGRWKPQQIRIWSLAYVRFWIVKTLIRSNPLVLIGGGRSHTSTSSPLFVLYLRALGAKIGRGVSIFSRNVPVCTDLLTIGDGTVIRKDSFFSCYRAQGGLIQTGPVTLGKNVFIGEQTVLDIGTSLGEGAQLGHSSALHAGQAVPAGERWHGSPGQRSETDYRRVAPARCTTLRRAAYATAQLLNVLLVSLPLTFGGVALLLTEVPQLKALLGAEPLAFTSGAFYRDALVVSFALLFGFLVLGLLFQGSVPRLLNCAIKPDKVYRLYGIHYWVHQSIARMTNRRFFTYLFGDSSYIVHYLRWLGYDLSHVEQTGSNFGTELKHETPFLCSVGSGTMVADGLSIINADFSSTSFRVSRASIGAHNFLGNYVTYPSGGTTGENCLLATKVMVPLDGDVREDIGLLGSPSFEIPRSVERDHSFDHLKGGDGLRRGLAAKNKHNIATIGWFLLVRWIYLFGTTLLALGAVDLYHSFGAVALALANLGVLLFTAVYFVLVERTVTGFRSLQPLFCSIYEPGFWRIERVWKVPAVTYLQAFNGTPFKNVIWRLLGVRLGRRVFDDGCYMSERTMVTIGNDATLNAESRIQPHSQEDGAYKSDRVTIGARATIGISALTHYGVTMGEGATLGPGSFLMKGEEVPPHAQWGGNPAREIRDNVPNPRNCKTATTTARPVRRHRAVGQLL